MDLDAFAAVRRQQWDRLAALSATRRLTGSEADELLRLYQLTSTHLSTIMTVDGESALTASLSTALNRARLKFTGAPGNAGTALGMFFTVSLPLAFYRIRWLTLALLAIFVAIALFYGFWINQDPQALASFASSTDLKSYTDSEFTGYYSANPAASFAGQVWTHNAFITAQMVAFGVTGIWAPFQIYLNAQGVGVSGGVMFAYGKGDVFFSYILPHGMLELTAVFIGGAAGLRIFWAWVHPGQQRRSTALATEGRSLITVALGLVLVLLVSGCIEGFVTPSSLPVWAKLTIGAAALALYWVYAWVLGGRAARLGYSSDLAEDERGAALPTAR